jgi:diacylglycerol O-acyltransferase
MDRLSAVDASFLYLEDSSTPMNVGGVAIFRPPPEGFDHERLVALIRRRIAFVPRYRQRVREVPFGISRPVWVDDEDFDVTFHVRRSALPRPGNREQLDELVGRLMSRPLDRSRPLWEMYLVEGLEDGCFAVITKSHQCLVDGLAAVDIAQVMLDTTPDATIGPPDVWQPRPEPSGAELLTAALTEAVARPAAAVDLAKDTWHDVTNAAGSVGSFVVGAVETVTGAVSSILRSPSMSPLSTRIGAQRRFATVTVPFEEIRGIRAAAGGSVNDAVLAVITGGLRGWLMARGEAVTQGRSLRALVPVSVESVGAGANQVAGFLVDLPAGEPDPVMRLRQISFHMNSLKQSERFIGADAIVSIAGFGPPTLHALGSRVGASLARRAYDLSITNVPGPQVSLYVAGSEMVEAYPCIPLLQGQALSIGITSYHGVVCIGLTADRDSMPDVDILMSSIHDAVAELREAATIGRRTLRSVTTEDFESA